MSEALDIAGQELRWIKPKWTRREFELHSGDAVMATLRWTRGSRAEGAFAGGEEYRFQREGWLRQRILIHQAADGNAGEPIASLTCRGGRLSFSDGQSFRWGKPRRWTNERVWFDGAGAEVMRFSPQRGGAAVRVQEGAAMLPEQPLLLLLGQYLLVLAADDAAAVAASTAAVIAST
jgi:hypothetical protein